MKHATISDSGRITTDTTKGIVETLEEFRDQELPDRCYDPKGWIVINAVNYFRIWVDLRQDKVYLEAAFKVEPEHSEDIISYTSNFLDKKLKKVFDKSPGRSWGYVNGSDLRIYGKGKATNLYSGRVEITDVWKGEVFKMR